tara:strand:- start:2023 stop:2607 length:585 start_codon:yes stop_codon:yes gene_type:complete
MLGALIQGGLGLYGMYKANKGMSNVANNMPSQKDLSGRLGESQGLIDRMTNFNQYSGGAMDLASQEGNQGVEDAMMMGMGGSQANAIRNRMKKSGMNQAYQSMQSGLGDAARMQQNNDQYVSTQMHENEQDSRQIRMGQAGAQMGIAGNMMGGAKGMGALGGQLSTGLGTMLRGKQGSGMGTGGLLGWGAGLFG